MSLPHIVFSGKVVALMHLVTLECKARTEGSVDVIISLSNGLVLNEGMMEEDAEKLLSRITGESE